MKKEILKRIYASIGCNGIAVTFNSKIVSFMEEVTCFCLVNAEVRIERTTFARYRLGLTNARILDYVRRRINIQLGRVA